VLRAGARSFTDLLEQTVSRRLPLVAIRAANESSERSM
jgi:hypothetical protein